MAALVMLAAATAPVPAAPTIATQDKADEAMARYRALTGGAVDNGTTARCADASGQIVVCARPSRPEPRLPLPDERAEAGAVTHHPGEPASGDPGRPTGPPSRLMQTMAKGLGLIREAITGEDPNQP